MEWLYLLATLASAIAAVLAWATKLWWGKEFAAAKDEIIKAKEAQIELLGREIESLRELTPMKIREYYLSMREQLEEYNNLLQNRLKEAKEELGKKEDDINQLKQEGTKRVTEVEKLEQERKHIADAATKLEQQLSSMRRKYESDDVVVMRIPRIDPQVFAGINTSMRVLTEALTKQMSTDFSAVSKSLLSSYSYLSTTPDENPSGNTSSSKSLGAPADNEKEEDEDKENNDEAKNDKTNDAA